MKLSNSRRGVIGAAVYVAAVAVTVVVAPAVHADGKYGAIATGPDGHWGIAYAEDSQYNANGFAGTRCGEGCRTAVRFTDCAALFRNGNDFFTGTGATKEAAEAAAQRPGAVEVSWACNNPPASGPTSWH